MKFKNYLKKFNKFIKLHKFNYTFFLFIFLFLGIVVYNSLNKTINNHMNNIFYTRNTNNHTKNLVNSLLQKVRENKEIGCLNYKRPNKFTRLYQSKDSLNLYDKNTNITLYLNSELKKELWNEKGELSLFYCYDSENTIGKLIGIIEKNLSSKIFEDLKKKKNDVTSVKTKTIEENNIPRIKSNKLQTNLEELQNNLEKAYQIINNKDVEIERLKEEKKTLYEENENDTITTLRESIQIKEDELKMFYETEKRWEEFGKTWELTQKQRRRDDTFNFCSEIRRLEYFTQEAKETVIQAIEWELNSEDNICIKNMWLKSEKEKEQIWKMLNENIVDSDGFLRWRFELDLNDLNAIIPYSDIRMTKISVKLPQNVVNKIKNKLNELNENVSGSFITIYKFNPNAMEFDSEGYLETDLI